MQTKHTIIPARSGTAFRLKTGDRLKITDIKGQQVSDLVAFAAANPKEYLSSGRSIDYAERLLLSTDDQLYSNLSRPMLTIVHDTVGRHDFTLTPCSADTFRIIYGDQNPHHGCYGNLERALLPFGISADMIPVAFNVFMHVDYGRVDNGFKISVLPPLSRAGDFIAFQAEMDLIIGLTACSAEQSNNFQFKEIGYQVN